VKGVPLPFGGFGFGAASTVAMDMVKRAIKARQVASSMVRFFPLPSIIS
jgi:hypothetical protein